MAEATQSLTRETININYKKTPRAKIGLVHDQSDYDGLINRGYPLPHGTCSTTHTHTHTHTHTPQTHAYICTQTHNKRAHNTHTRTLKVIPPYINICLRQQCSNASLTLNCVKKKHESSERSRQRGKSQGRIHVLKVSLRGLVPIQAKQETRLKTTKHDTNCASK